MNVSAGAPVLENRTADPWLHHPNSVGVAFAWFANFALGGSTRHRIAAGASSRSFGTCSRWGTGSGDGFRLAEGTVVP